MQKLFAFCIALSLLALVALTSFVPNPGHSQSLIPHPQSPAWGFFAHKRINRLAVLTLPPEMMVFFKPHIDWLTDHAVDPDMRRYASKLEAPRHYIDLDVYGTPPFDNLPRLWVDAMIKYTDIGIVTEEQDTFTIVGPAFVAWQPEQDFQFWPDSAQRDYRNWFIHQLLPNFYVDKRELDVSLLSGFLDKHGFGVFDAHTGKQKVIAAFYEEHLSEHGIVPWHLQKMQRDLTEAFRQRSTKRILRICADMGHYIGDAHVPLHTTSNYNGEKTGQHGIHGFWESRVPELFADAEYDFFVGKPEYLSTPADFFWQVVFDSHSMVDSVLTMERNLSRSFPPDRQMCPDMRNGLSVLTPCRDYAAAYQTALQGMMERRMRAAIHAVSSAWYTAWVDAGQPDLTKMDEPLSTEEELKEEAELKTMFGQGKILGRPEEH